MLDSLIVLGQFHFLNSNDKGNARHAFSFGKLGAINE